MVRYFAQCNCCHKFRLKRPGFDVIAKATCLLFFLKSQCYFSSTSSTNVFFGIKNRQFAFGKWGFVRKIAFAHCSQGFTFRGLSHVIEPNTHTRHLLQFFWAAFGKGNLTNEIPVVHNVRGKRCWTAFWMQSGRFAFCNWFFYSGIGLFHRRCASSLPFTCVYGMQSGCVFLLSAKRALCFWGRWFCEGNILVCLLRGALFVLLNAK